MVNLFYCYSTNLQNFIRNVKGIRYVLVAKHIDTNKVFYAYERTEELDKVLTEYYEMGKVHRKK